MSITYNYQDGTQKKLTFVERSDHYYYMLEDGTYNGIVVRLNNFTGAGTITPAYEALTRALNEKTK